MNTTTITLPTELAEKLKTMAIDRKNQDNRCTANPYYFTIREMKRVYGMDPDHSYDDYVWIHKDDFECSYEPDELPEDFDEKDYYKCYYSMIEHHSNVFLTEKEADRHLRVNRHHYNATAATYVEYAHRNLDLETIVELLTELAKEGV